MAAGSHDASHEGVTQWDGTTWHSLHDIQATVGAARSRRVSGPVTRARDAMTGVKLGIAAVNIGGYASLERLREVASRAETAGLESLWVVEHVVLASPRVPPSPLNPAVPILDPVVTLGFLAGVTEGVRLGTGVVVLPFRNPVVLAKELATLDVLSNGRLEFGVGVGYVEREFEAVGVPFDRRGQLTDEYLLAMTAMWTQDQPTYEGEFVRLSGVEAHPHPVQRPYPRVVVGGRTRPALRRAVMLGHGWYGYGLGAGETAAILDRLAEARGQHKRPDDLGPLEITVTPDRIIDRAALLEYAALGVHRVNLLLPRDASAVGEYFETVVADLVAALD